MYPLPPLLRIFLWTSFLQKGVNPVLFFCCCKKLWRKKLWTNPQSSVWRPPSDQRLRFVPCVYWKDKSWSHWCDPWLQCSSLSGGFRNQRHGIRLPPPQQTESFISGQRGYPLPPFKLADGKYHKRTRTDSVTAISYTFPYIGPVKGASGVGMGGGTSVISGKMSTKSKAEYSPSLPFLTVIWSMQRKFAKRKMDI